LEYLHLRKPPYSLNQITLAIWGWFPLTISNNEALEPRLPWLCLTMGVYFSNVWPCYIRENICSSALRAVDSVFFHRFSYNPHGLQGLWSLRQRQRGHVSMQTGGRTCSKASVISLYRLGPVIEILMDHDNPHHVR
jgi:hypothetical protein